MNGAIFALWIAVGVFAIGCVLGVLMYEFACWWSERR